LLGFVRRNVAVNSPVAPMATIKFPMTASMYDLVWCNADPHGVVPEQ
jgi:hypothetical protein